jgi:hypothetical protein
LLDGELHDVLSFGLSSMLMERLSLCRGPAGSSTEISGSKLVDCRGEVFDGGGASAVSVDLLRFLYQRALRSPAFFVANIGLPVS